jgi:glycosyltransferase involved in cell wall biosynthesis
MIEKTPLISIIINTHNDVEYIEEAIDSALNQTYQNFEIILYDNASEKKVFDVAQKYKDKIIYRRSESFLTLGAARNAAIAESKGEFITFLDADDIFFPQKLEMQLPLFSDPEVGLVYSNTSHLIKKESSWVDEVLHMKPMPDGYIFSDLLKGNFIPFNTAVIKRTVLTDDSSKWFNESFDFCTDYDLFLRISYKYKVKYVNEPLGKWRIHGSNYTFKKPHLISAERYLMIPRVLDYEPELFDKYKKEMNCFVAEIFLDMSRYFMHVGQRYKAILCVLNALMNDLNSKNFRVLMHYLLPFIKKIRTKP